MGKINLKRIRPIIGMLLASLIIIFLLKNRNNVNFSFFRFDRSILMYSTLLYSLFCFFNALIFHYIFITIYGDKIPLRESLWIFFASLQGKYIPGKMGNLLVKYYYMNEKEMASKEVFKVFIAEQGIMMIAGIVIVLFSILFRMNPIPIPELSHSYIWGMALIAFLIGVAMYLIKRQKKWGTVAVYVFISYLVSWVVLTFALALFISGMGSGISMGLGDAFSTSIAYIVSIIGGFLSLITPGGLGVREFIFSYIQTNKIADPNFILLGVLIRSWTIVVELSLLAVSFLLLKLNRVKHEPI